MATLILRPDNPGDVCTIPNEVGAACPDHYLNVDEVIPDEGATQIYDNCIFSGPTSFDSYDLYSIANHGVAVGVINWVKAWIRVKASGTGGGGAGYTKIKTLGVEYTGGAVGAVAYANYFTQYNNHPVGGAWTWLQIDLLQGGVRLAGSCGEEKGDIAEAACDQVWIEVDYTPPAPGGGAVSGNIGHKMIGEGLI